MGKASKIKGDRLERDVQTLLDQTQRFDLLASTRSNQRRGGTDLADISIPLIHLECKADESLSIYAAIGQAVDDCVNKIPCVIHKRRRQGILLTCLDEQWSDLCAAWNKLLDMRDMVLVMPRVEPLEPRPNFVQNRSGINLHKVMHVLDKQESTRPPLLTYQLGDRQPLTTCWFCDFAGFAEHEARSAA